MEDFLMGISTTGLGMLIVFLGLVFLMLIMMGLSVVNRMGARKAAPSKRYLPAEPVKPAKTEVMAASEEPAAAPAAEAPATDRSGEEIAAIAAVLAILTAEGVQGTVTAVRRLGGNAATWALAGRRDIMASRL
jgi:Na+-transporting methylmalonyl-CoA/oxaloacetate decarboxylase gamma subunit